MTAEEYEHDCQRLEERNLQLKYLYAELAETDRILNDAKNRKSHILWQIRFTESSRDCLRRKIACQMP